MLAHLKSENNGKRPMTHGILPVVMFEVKSDVCGEKLLSINGDGGWVGTPNYGQIL